jgi:hypothetical protein
VQSPEILKMSKETLISEFKENWPKITMANKVEVCTKIGINILNHEKNIQAFDQFDFGSSKESKL